MKMISLQSGSNGNSIYVEAGEVRLLFDAGISGLRAQQRLADCGCDIRRVDALLISHDHVDHVRCAGVYHRRFGLPVYMTGGTLAAATARQGLGQVAQVHRFKAGATLRFGNVSIQTLPTPHDGAEGVAFVVCDGRQRLGILTDLGHVFGALPEVIASLDAVLLESNYDPDLLRDGPYPPSLQERIRGPGGHLSNLEAAELLHDCAGRGMKWACLGHLSGENNDPQLALQTHRRILPARLPLHVATRHEHSAVMVL